MKNILLTGAGPRSFIGRNLKEQLQSGFQVFAPTHTELELLDYVALESYIRKHQIDAIVHAAIHVAMFNGAENLFYNDMLMFMNIEKASSLVEKIIYFGSGAEYDKRYDITMARETDIGRHIPGDEYGLAKYAMNLLARRSQNIHNFRLFGVFGKYELWEIKFLSNLCCKAMFDLPLTIRQDCLFDFLHVDDITPAVAWALDHQPPRQDYNLCYGRPYRLTELAEMIKEISGTQADIVVLDRGQNLDYTGDNALLLQDCPVFSPTSTREVLNSLYCYYQKHRGLIDLEKLRASK